MNITARFVNEVKQGKNGEFFTIKDANGNTYFVNGEYRRLFTQGYSYDIEFHGDQYKWITGIGGTPLDVLIKGDAAQQAGQAVPSAYQQPSPSSPPAAAAPSQAARPEPPPILSNVLAHAIGNGAKPEDLPEWAKWTREAIKSFYASDAPSGATDPNDEIPW